MVEGRQRDDWNRHGLYLWMFWNANYQKRAVPANFDPFSPEFLKIGRGSRITRGSISMLKGFVPKKGQRKVP